MDVDSPSSSADLVEIETDVSNKLCATIHIKTFSSVSYNAIASLHQDADIVYVATYVQQPQREEGAEEQQPQREVAAAVRDLLVRYCWVRAFKKGIGVKKI